MNALQIKEMALKTNANFGMSVLDLPIERQKELAKQQGLTLEQWTKQMTDMSSAMQEHRVKIITVKSEEEANKMGYELPHWHDEPLPIS